MAWIACAVIFGCVYQLTDASTTPGGSVSAVSNGNNAFAKDLYETLSGTTGNLVFSPLSLETVLAMAWFGTAGDTASEIVNAIKLPDNKEEIKLGFRELISRLNNEKNITLDTANKLYVSINTRVNEDYLNAVRENFFSDVEATNFSRPETTQEINHWVENKTQNKIKDLFQPGSLSALTSAVLVNAIYFRGGWTLPFDYTFRTPFYLNRKVNKSVETMHLTDRFKYAELTDMKIKVVQLDYVEDAKMLIILPDEVEGLKELEKNFKRIDLNNIKQKLTTKSVSIYLPKFKIETSLNLEEALQQIGIKKMFSDGADFTPITKNNLKVDSVVQKAFIEVDETGTTAAAATGLTVVEASLTIPAEPVYLFQADHPFLFLLYSSDTGAILFAGRVLDPESKMEA